MRMSKNRFFQILETGLGVYADAERKSLEDELEMIRSSVLIQEPEEMALFRELDEALSELEKVSFESMTAEEFRVLQENMGHCSSVLNDITTVIVMLAELVNQLCVMILSEPQAIAGLEEKEGIREILGAVLSLMKGGIKEPVSEALYEQFAFLEGKQELLMDGFAQGASAVDEICQEQKKRIENLGLSEEFESLRLISRLMSGSLFVELREDESLKQICGKDYTRKAAAKLQEELLEKFEGLKKYQVRAVMAKVLSFLPPFLLSGEEVRSYIAESLGSCKDEAEKIGCVEILTSLLSDY